jgi:curli production assembly/transport component CsgE
MARPRPKANPKHLRRWGGDAMNRHWLPALLLMLMTSFVSAAEEDEMMGFIVDDTISHIGHDFYYSFSERLRATSPMDFNLVVRERPSARWGSLVTVEYQQRLVYRRFLPPNTVELKDEAYEAADLVRVQIVQRRLETLLQDTTDLERDEL